MMKKITILSLILIAMLFGEFPLTAQVSEGEMAPDFSYKDTDGIEFKLSDQLGKVVFVFVFGNGCPYCLAVGDKTESDIYQVFNSNDDFVAVGVDVWDGSSSVASVNSFKSQTGITYPLLVKAGGVSTSYGITYDRVMVIDKAGVLRHKGNTATSNDLENAASVIQQYLLASGNKDLSGTPGNRIVGLFPNPVFDEARLRFSISERNRIKYSVFNSLGQKVYQSENEFDAGISTLQLNTEKLNRGMHFYMLELENGQVLSGKFLVNK